MAFLWFLLAPQDPADRYIIKNPKSKEAAAQWIAIAPKPLVHLLQPLAEHRLKTGMESVAILPMEEIVAMDPARPPEQSLQMFSRDAAKQGGGKYIFLVGAAAQVPTLTVNMQNSPVFVSDSGFVCDDNDPIPDRAVGRLPSSDEATVAAVVERLITYEKNTKPGGWRRRINFLAASGGFGPAVDTALDATVADFLDRDLPSQFDLRVLRPETGSAFGTEFIKEKDNILDLYASGSLVSIYAGHGSRHGFHTAVSMGVTRPILVTSDISRLEVRSGAPFIIIFACDTGQFGDSGKRGRAVNAPECIGEAFFTNRKGAVAVFAASENSHPYPDLLLAHGMNELFRESSNARIGDLVLAAKRKLAKEGGDAFREKIDKFADLFGLREKERDRLRDYEVSLYNLFGDPATILGGPTARATVTTSKTAAPGDELPFEVNCSVPDGTGVTATLELSRGATPRYYGYPAANDRVLRQCVGEIKNGKFSGKFTIPNVRASRIVVIADVRGEAIQGAGAAAVEVKSVDAKGADVKSGDTAR